MVNAPLCANSVLESESFEVEKQQRMSIGSSMQNNSFFKGWDDFQCNDAASMTNVFSRESSVSKKVAAYSSDVYETLLSGDDFFQNHKEK